MIALLEVCGMVLVVVSTITLIVCMLMLMKFIIEVE